MKIAYLMPGSGGTFYCGNCTRDKVFVDALKNSGHEIFMIPMYLPLTLEDCDADSPIFYGAVNIYLEQLHPIFKKLPSSVKRFLDSDKVLRFAGKLSGSTKASGNENMTISMLKGSKGKQSENLDELVKWLKTHEKPDVVHLSNALISGLAEKIKTEIGCTVICTLQDEDEWIDEMREPYASTTWKLIENNAAFIDAFIAVSDYYAQLIKRRIYIPENKIFVVHNSINTSKLVKNNNIITHHSIGYMSKINSLFGADILFDAFVILKQDPQFADLKLKYTGGYTDDHKEVVGKIINESKRLGIESDVEFFDDLSVAGKKKFFASISLFCLPSRRKEAFGIQLLESFASEIPVIVPDIGGNREIVAKSKAGILYKHNDFTMLVERIKELLTDDSMYNKLRDNCHLSLTEHFDVSIQTKKIIEIYSKHLF